jgi:hypothetical protein
MESIELLRHHLRKSETLVLARIEDMRDHAVVFPTANGGCHTLWVLGHLAFIEALVIRTFMRGEVNPLAAWEPIFDGEEPRGDRTRYPPFDELLARCREERASTIAALDRLTEAELDSAGAKTPKGFDDTFGTWRLCLQYAADHWYMHRGQLADARRAAGVARMWL